MPAVNDMGRRAHEHCRECGVRGCQVLGAWSLSSSGLCRRICLPAARSAAGRAVCGAVKRSAGSLGGKAGISEFKRSAGKLGGQCGRGNAKVAGGRAGGRAGSGSAKRKSADQCSKAVASFGCVCGL